MSDKHRIGLGANLPPRLSRPAMFLGLTVAAALLSAPAQAYDRGGWHGGGGGWGWGVGAGLAAGLAIDAAVGWPGYYPGYYYAQPYPYAYPAPAVTVIQAAPAAVVAPVAAPAPAQAPSWYFCSNPKGYYPYVRACSTAWQQVPATPPTP